MKEGGNMSNFKINGYVTTTHKTGGRSGKKYGLEMLRAKNRKSAEEETRRVKQELRKHIREYNGRENNHDIYGTCSTLNKLI